MNAEEPHSLGGAIVYAEWVKEELGAEEHRRTSLEARGSATIAASGALVTLLFGLAALLTSAIDFVLPPYLRIRLVVVLAAFLLSAIAAIGTYAPLLSRTVDPRDLLPVLRARWTDKADDAQKKVTSTRLASLQRVQGVNNIKGVLLLLSVSLQVVAIVILSWAVLDILREV